MNCQILVQFISHLDRVSYLTVHLSHYALTLRLIFKTKTENDYYHHLVLPPA